jgi:WD40 repeat protein
MRSETPRIIGVVVLLALPPALVGQELELRKVLNADKTPFGMLALNHDGKVLGSMARQYEIGNSWTEFQIWDTATAKPLVSIKGNGQNSGNIVALAISPDGQTLASIDSLDRAITLWSVAERSVRSSIAITGFPATIAFSADGKKVGAATQKVILVCDATTGAKLTMAKWRSPLAGVTFSPDLRFFATDFYQDLDLRDTATGKLLRTLPDHPGTVDGFAFSNDGKKVAVTVHMEEEVSAHYSKIFVWDIATAKQQAAFKGFGHCISVAFAVNDKHLILLAEKAIRTGWIELKTLDLVTGKVRTAVRFEENQRPTWFTVSGDGRTVAVACKDGCVQIFRVK